MNERILARGYDDRVLKPTREVAVAIIPVLVAAFAILYLFPTRTRQLWSWEMHPTMTAMVMGAGYLSGAYFFYRAATVTQWHRVGLGFVAITAFTAMLAIATIAHWDRFNHDHVSFWAWVLLYFSTPVLLPWLWARNRGHDPHRLEPGDRLVPTPVRVAMVALGAAQLAVAAVMYLRPTAIAAHAPWTLTPLTCRSLSAFAAFPSIIYLAFGIEKRWSSFQILIEVAIAGMVLIGIAAIRAHGELHGGDAVVWGWEIGLATALVFLVGSASPWGDPSRRLRGERSGRTSRDMERGGPDGPIVERLRAGDEAAFRELVGRHHQAMIQFAATFVPSRAVAEEVVQEAWLGVIKGIHRFEGRSALSTWIFRIVANITRTRGQRERRTVSLSEEMTWTAPSVPAGRFRGPPGRGSGRSRRRSGATYPTSTF